VIEVSTEEQRTVMSRTEVLYWIGLDSENLTYAPIQACQWVEIFFFWVGMF
jgi:hypothetical protein